MAISVFDLFSIGIGPSSSHTVGPMKAALAFVRNLGEVGTQVTGIEATLYGSLAYTGRGHGTHDAVILGLAGEDPETVDPAATESLLRAIRADRVLNVPGIGRIDFDPESRVVFNFDEELPRHTNGMRFRALDTDGAVLFEDIYCSLGGGFIARGEEPEPTSQSGEPKYLFDSGDALLRLAADNELSIADLAAELEARHRD